jgi:hypothetical protein
MRRFIELVIRVRQLVAHAPTRVVPTQVRARVSARRQVGRSLSQFSFRLAFMIDLAYVGIGALGGTAIERALNPATSASTPACSLDTPWSWALPKPAGT